MLLNAYFTWNMSLSDSNVKGHHHVKKDHFYAAVAEEFINYKVTQSELAIPPQPSDMHLPGLCSFKQPHCVICSLEMGMMKESDRKDIYGLLLDHSNTWYNVPTSTTSNLLTTCQLEMTEKFLNFLK